MKKQLSPLVEHTEYTKDRKLAHYVAAAINGVIIVDQGAAFSDPDGLPEYLVTNNPKTLRMYGHT